MAYNNNRKSNTANIAKSTQKGQSKPLPNSRDSRKQYTSQKKKPSELADLSSKRCGTSTGNKPRYRETFVKDGNDNSRWPSRPGRKQYDWEEPRTVKSGMGRAVDGSRKGLDSTTHRVDRLRLLGNGCVPQQVAKAWETLWQSFI